MAPITQNLAGTVGASLVDRDLEAVRLHADSRVDGAGEYHRHFPEEVFGDVQYFLQNDLLYSLQDHTFEAAVIQNAENFRHSILAAPRALMLASSILKAFKKQLCPEEPSAEWFFKSKWWRYQKLIQNLLGWSSDLATACGSAASTTRESSAKLGSYSESRVMGLSEEKGGQAFAKAADMVTARAMDYGMSFLSWQHRLTDFPLRSTIVVQAQPRRPPGRICKIKLNCARQLVSSQKSAEMTQCSRSQL